MKRTASLLGFFLFFILFSSITLSSHSQNGNQAALTQVRVLLSSKGLNEAEVLQRLKSKGLDVEKMSQDDLLKNRGLIEQTVAEMEAEKKSITPYSKSDTTIETSLIKLKEAEEIPKQDSVSKKPELPLIYGHKMFKEKSLEIYRVSRDASPPDNYILAPGDKINILIFGRSQADLIFEINSAGFIQPSQMPKIFLSGLTLKQAKELLVDRFATYYVFAPGQFALTLNTSRTLTVNVFGEVERAGSFTTSALNTALGALAVAGGPTEIGSVRNIQIIRGSTRKTLDVYGFMRDPAIQFDFYLQNNDIIYVPASQKLVSLEGAVNRPMRYELKAGEGLKELLEYAGGLRVDAFSDLLQIQRIENNQIVLKDYDLNKLMQDASQLELKHGDIIRIKAVNSPLKSFVRITGAVEYSGEYDWSNTKTIKSLLEKSKLIPEARRDLAFVLRKNPDQTLMNIPFSVESILNGSATNFNLEKEDEVLVYDRSMLTPNEYSLAVLGDVVEPMEKRFNQQISISIDSAIQLAGGLKPNASGKAYIYRNDPLKYGKTIYLPIDLSTAGTQILKPWDKLVVFSKEENRDEPTVTISGDVKNPTTLNYSTEYKFKDLVSIAGGFNLSTDTYFAEVFRLEFKPESNPIKRLIRVELDAQLNPKSPEFVLAPYDQVVFRRITDFTLQEAVSISGEIVKEGPYVLQNKKYHFSDLIKDAGGLTEYADLSNVSLIRYMDSAGVLVFDASKAITSKRNLAYDPILMERDYIIVPRISNTVSIETVGTNFVLGKSQNLLLITYQGDASARWYINEFAGGFAENSNKNKVLVVKPNGIQKSTKRFIFRSYPKVERGDKIVTSIKIKEKKEKGEGKGVDWDKMVSRIIALFSALALIQAYVK